MAGWVVGFESEIFKQFDFEDLGESNGLEDSVAFISLLYSTV
jgi:hypothetical protein